MESSLGCFPRQVVPFGMDAEGENRRLGTAHRLLLCRHKLCASHPLTPLTAILAEISPPANLAHKPNDPGRHLRRPALTVWAVPAKVPPHVATDRGGAARHPTTNPPLESSFASGPVDGGIGASLGRSHGRGRIPAGAGSDGRGWIMDDVPPGPTAPEPRRPALLVVIPVHNGGRDFERCLRRLRESRGADFELIVVDDGSTDDSAATGPTVRCVGCCAIRPPRGPASARNDGAKAATADLVFFLDADVAVHPDTLATRLRPVSNPTRSSPPSSAPMTTIPPHPASSASFGTCSTISSISRASFVDDVRPAQTFWTGCGAIRRQAFLDFGGFDPRLYARPAIEDIEFGYRLTRRGLSRLCWRATSSALI